MENTTAIQTNGNGGRPVKIDIAPSIREFIGYVHAGVSAWEKAGEILVKLRNEDPGVFRKITDAYEFITADSLEIFYSIGIRTLYPLTMLLPRRVSSAVRLMRYDAQKKVCQEPVNVVSRMVGDKAVIERKSVAKLTEREVKQALYPKGNRSVDWQVRKLTAPSHDLSDHAKKEVWRAPAPTTRVPVSVGFYAVRRAAAGAGFCFEKTPARPVTTQRVLLTSGQAVIELTEYKADE